MENIPRQITITTKRAKKYRILPAEGALGGITPSQMYQINFYIESPNIPIEMTHELSEDGKLGDQINQVSEGGEIIREIQCAVLMTVPQAESLAHWILNTIKNQNAGDLPITGPVM